MSISSHSLLQSNVIAPEIDCPSQPPKIRLKLLFPAKTITTQISKNTPNLVASPPISNSSQTSPTQNNLKIHLKKCIIQRNVSKRQLIQSCPSPSIKRIRLTLKDPPALSHIPKKPFKKRKLSKLDSIPNIHFADPISTRERAEIAVRWAISTNSWLTKTFQITTLLGWGSCGAVLKASRKSDGFQVAIKLVYKTPSLEMTNNVPTEIDILKGLKNPNIINFISYNQDSKLFYLVMELFGTPWRDAHELKQSIVIKHSRKKTCTESTLLTITNGSCSTLFDFIDWYGSVPFHLHRMIFKQVANSIYCLHNQQIIHGDIKEENILVQQENYGVRVKLCDFGHARKVKRSRPTMKFYGTRDISAPELLKSMHNYEVGSDDYEELPFTGYAQDIWALGIVLYTMIHGSLPPNNEDYLNGLDLSNCVYFPTFYDERIPLGPWI